MTAARDTLWINCHAATMTVGGAAYGAIEDAALVTRGGRIAWIGKRIDVPDDAPAPQVDLGGHWITPGLVDCHTHLVYDGNRAREFEMRLQGASYEAIARGGGGIVSTVRATRAASEAQLLHSALERLDALRAEGVTVIEIKSGYGLEPDTERRMLSVARRLGEARPVTTRTTCLAAHAVPPEFAGRGDEYIDLVCRRILPELAEAGLVDAVDAFCEHIAFSPEQVARVFDTARELGLPVKLHAEQLSDQGGATLAASYGALSADHLEYASEAGVRALAEAGAVAVLLPGAFYTLGQTQAPPVERLRAHGVPMALATDANPGTSPACSLRLMLNMGCRLFGLTPEEALAGVTREGARALGLGHDYGTLQAGKAADFAVWRIDHPAELSYWLGGNPCVQTIRGGTPV